VTLPLTLSVALPPSGLRDLTPHLARQRQDRRNAPPRQRRRAPPIQSALPSSTNLTLPACAMLCQTSRRLLQSMRSTSTASDRLKPRNLPCPIGFEPHLGLGFGPAPSSSVTGWCNDPCGATPTKLRRVRTRSAFAAQETSHGRDSRGVDQAGLYPDPSNLDTFCRELAGLPAGEADIPQALAHLYRAHQGSQEHPDKPSAASSSRARACFREARGLPPRLRRTVSCQDRFTLSPATGRAIRCAQGVFCPEEAPPDGQPWPGEPSKGHRRPKGGPLSTGCSHPVDKGPALFFHPASCRALTEQA